MRSRFSRLMPAACLGLGSLFVTVAVSPAFAQKNKKPAPKEAVGTSIEKQSAWEQKVMGDDSEKKAEMKKIAAAQKMAEEARKNPPPEPAVHHKDPSKEGVNAKREASIGLPIEDDMDKPAHKKAPVAKKADTNEADDELGAFVAASLASEKKSETAADEKSVASASPGRKVHGRKGKGRKGKPGKAAATDAQPNALDRMFGGGQ